MRKIITILFLLFSHIAFSQSWENLTNKDWVYAIDEDEGYLWLGTNGGIIRLNKQTRETKTYNRADTRIPDNNVYDLELENNTIWLGSRHSGIGLYEDGVCFTYNFLNSNIPFEQWNSAICVDSNGTKYIGSLGYVSKFDGNNFEIIKEMDILLAFDNVSDIEVDIAGNVWMACNSGLYKYDGTNTVRIEDVTGYNLGSIIIDNNGTIWVSSNTGLHKCSNGFWFSFNTDNSDLIKNELFKMSIDANNTLWIGADDYLISYTSSGEWHNYECLNSETGNFLIFTVYIDEDDNLWIGTRENGLMLFENGLFEKLDYSTSSALPSNAVNFELVNDKMWFGWKNGLFTLQGDNYDTINSNLPYPEVVIQAVDQEGNIWLTNRKTVLTPEGAISNTKFIKFNGTDFEEYEIPPVLGQQIVLEIDNNGIFWLGTKGAGLYKWDGFTWTNYNKLNSPLTSDIINEIDFDSKGNIWIGQNGDWNDLGEYTGGGLMKFDGDIKWQEYNISNSGLPYKSITALYVDEEDVVWLGTVNDGRWDGGGLTRFDGENWHSYTTDNSYISDNQVISIIEDSDGMIWSGTLFGGLVKFDKGDSWEIYMQHNSGIASNQVGGLLIDRDNKLYMGHNIYSGVSIFDKNSSNISTKTIQNDNILKLYPNPTSDCITIESMNQTEKIKSIKTFDLTGKLIYKKNYPKRITEIKLNIKDFYKNDTGMLIIEVETDNSLIRRKIIIKN